MKKLKVKSNDWLIKGVPKEQLEKEKIQAIRESDMELFAIKLKERSFIDQLSTDKDDRLVYVRDIDALLEEMKEHLNKT